jgi:hypothetical protein
MKHKASHELYAYWDDRREGRIMPDRDAIDPTAIRNILADCFLLAQERAQEAVLRLAGSRMYALFGRELKGSAFLDLWSAANRTEIRRMVDHSESDSSGVIAGAIGHAEGGATVETEWLLLPLLNNRKLGARYIGVLAPYTIPMWLGLRPVRELTLTSWRRIGPSIMESVVPRDVVLPPEPAQRPALVLHHGGRT